MYTTENDKDGEEQRCMICGKKYYIKKDENGRYWGSREKMYRCEPCVTDTRSSIQRVIERYQSDGDLPKDKKYY